MNLISKLILGCIAILGFTLATPAEARHHSDGHYYYRNGHRYYSSRPVVVYRSYRPTYYYSRRPVVYYDDYGYSPYYYHRPSVGLSIGFGGSRYHSYGYRHHTRGWDW